MSVTSNYAAGRLRKKRRTNPRRIVEANPRLFSMVALHTIGSLRQLRTEAQEIGVDQLLRIAQGRIQSSPEGRQPYHVLINVVDTGLLMNLLGVVRPEHLRRITTSVFDYAWSESRSDRTGSTSPYQIVVSYVHQSADTKPGPVIVLPAQSITA